MYCFDQNLRTILEKLSIPLAIYQVIDHQVVTLLVSDGLCLFTKDSREHLTNAFNQSMFERVAPEDVGKLLALGNSFTKHESDYDVIYHSKDFKGNCRLIHTVGYWQTMEDGTELAFLYYTNLAHSINFNEEVNDIYQKKQNDLFYIDPLTKLPNLNYLYQFGIEKANALRLNHKQPLLIFYDVCAIRSYNGQYGYEAGNELLILVSLILKQNYPHALITRFSDDHFIVLTETTPYDMELIRNVNDSIIKQAKCNTTGIKAGLCLLSPHDTILAAVDHASHALKTIGNDVNTRAAYYTLRISEEYLQQQYIVAHFQEALENHYIHVYYQRIVKNSNQQVAYAEALARWIDPEKGFISPGEFIPVLSQYHLTYKLDLHMVEQICKEYNNRKANAQKVVPVSINLSAQDFDHIDMHKKINSLLNHYHVPTDYLVIEITEEAVAQASENFTKQLNLFIVNGFKVWVDDFGSGYSNLDVFTRYHFHLIKIDQTLIQDIDEHESVNKVIINAIIQTAQKLNILTLCEGVETEAQYQFVKESGCDFTQGFYFYKPTPSEDL